MLRLLGVFLLPIQFNKSECISFVPVVFPRSGVPLCTLFNVACIKEGAHSYENLHAHRYGFIATTVL